MAVKRPSHTQDRFVLAYDHVAVTADTTIKLFKATRPMRIDSVQYINVTGLVEDAANFFAISVKNGATVMAGPLSTDSAAVAVASIVADTFTPVPLSATAANQVLAADDILSLVLDETGIATLPAGRLVIEGRYL